MPELPAIFKYAQQYEDKEIRITCEDGDVVSGVFVDFQSFGDVDDEPETITLRSELDLIEIPFLDIVKTEILDE